MNLISPLRASARRIAIGVAVGVALIGVSAAAVAAPAYISVGNLVERCTNGKESDFNICQGFLLGVIDAGNGVHYCLDPSIRFPDLAKPLLAALAKLGPDAADAPANEVLIGGLAKVFPCKEEPQPSQREQQRNPRGGNWS